MLGAHIPAKKPGRPRRGTKPRETLSVSVESGTKGQLLRWCRDLGTADNPAAPGLVVDALVEHGQTKGFQYTIARIRGTRP